MEYHSDRFKDNSLMFYRKGQLVGLASGQLKGRRIVESRRLNFRRRNRRLQH